MISARLLLASTLLVAASAAHGGENEKVVRRDFKVPTGGNLTVRTDIGDIDIRTGSDDRVSIEARVGADVRDARKAAKRIAEFKIDMVQRGNSISINGDDGGDSSTFWNIFSDNIRVRFLVSVPRRFNVDVNTSGGDVAVGDLQGAVKLRTSGGDLRAGDIEGTLEGHTSGGDIHLRSASGPSEVNTSGGDISIGRITTQFKAQTSGGDISIQSASGAIDASTSGGSVDVQFVSQLRGSSRLSTSGGDVVVHLPRNAKLNLDAKCSGGRVVSDVPIRVSGRMEEDELEGTMNGGGPMLSLRSSAGRIEIRGR